MDGDTLLIEATESWEMWFNESYGLDIHSGKILWDIVGVRRYADKGFFVMERVNAAVTEFSNLTTFRLAIFNRHTRQMTAPQFAIPERPGCGNTRQHLDDAMYAESWFDARYLYTRRKDACGVFMARFDWHGPDGQFPVITPQP